MSYDKIYSSKLASDPTLHTHNNDTSSSRKTGIKQRLISIIYTSWLHYSKLKTHNKVLKKLASFSLHPPSLLNMGLVDVEPKSTNPMLRTEGELKKIFKQHDANKDGLLSQAELKKAFQCLGSWIPGIRASNGIHHADANKDGQIDDQELNKLVEYAMQLGYTVKA